MKNVALHNLGCKVNSYELDVIEQDLIENGYNIVPFNEIADVYIINTCTVTNIADRKSRQMLHRAKKENPNAIVIALGCYVETSKKQVEKDPCIDIAVGNNRKKDVVKILMEYEKQQESCETSLDENTLTNEKVRTPVMEMDASIEVGSKEETKYENMELTNAPEHTRAYIKIQDGCNQFCSYCLIPYARGRIRSREQSDVVREIEGLAQKGVKEVVITGIHVSSYGLDRGQSEFIELLQKVHEIEGIERIRLSSLEPRIITQENAKALASMPKVCPHFHLSLQSGCQSVLERMNRHYTSSEYKTCVDILRNVYDKPAITTDVIVGFPGETEEEFEESRAFCEDINFYEMHVFKYSVRQGTAAARMKDQLTDRQKTERSNVLLNMTKKHSEEYRKLFLGETVKILWEDIEEINEEKFLVGHNERYVKFAKKVSELKDNEKSGNITSAVATCLAEDGSIVFVC